MYKSGPICRLFTAKAAMGCVVCAMQWCGSICVVVRDSWQQWGSMGMTAPARGPLLTTHYTASTYDVSCHPYRAMCNGSPRRFAGWLSPSRNKRASTTRCIETSGWGRARRRRGRPWRRLWAAGSRVSRAWRHRQGRHRQGFLTDNKIVMKPNLTFYYCIILNKSYWAYYIYLTPVNLNTFTMWFVQ